MFASSAKAGEVEHYLELLGARQQADAWTTSGDVQATKPAPDLVHAAIAKVGGTPEDAVMIGDSPWDVRAASEAGVNTIAVQTGGFAEQELYDAGAVVVFESVGEIVSKLSETELR